jgi:hypothetical protein
MGIIICFALTMHIPTLTPGARTRSENVHLPASVWTRVWPDFGMTRVCLSPWHGFPTVPNFRGGGCHRADCFVVLSDPVLAYGAAGGWDCPSVQRFTSWLRVRNLQCNTRGFTVAALHRETITHVWLFL